MLESAAGVFPQSKKGPRRETGGGFFFVRPAGRTLLEVKVLYIPGKGKC
jgi:hypothetical protein